MDVDEVEEYVEGAKLKEFADYQRIKQDRRDKQDWYGAVIAALCSGQEKANPEDFLYPTEEGSEPIKLDPKELANTMAAWFGAEKKDEGEDNAAGS